LREFSNYRGVVKRGEGDMIDAFYAPCAKAAEIVQAVWRGLSKPLDDRQ